MSGQPFAPGRDDTMTVQLLGIPLDLLERAREHHESLERELQLLTLSATPGTEDVATRVLELEREVREPAAAIGAAQADAVDAAYARGDETVDLAVAVPSSAARACRRLAALLDEADEFCRRGDLLNVATPPDCVELRRWYLDQIVAQLEGAPPTPWDNRG